MGKVGKPNILNILQRRLGGEGVGTGVGKGLGTPAGRKGRLPETLPHLPHRVPTPSPLFTKRKISIYPIDSYID